MRNVRTACAVLFIVLLAACGAPSGASTPGACDGEAALASPTIGPVVEPPMPPASTTDGDAGEEQQATNLTPEAAGPDPVLKLVEALRGRQIELKPSGESRIEFLADAPGQAYQVGWGWLHLHVYPSAEEAGATQDEVRQGLSNPVADPPAPPHAFQCAQIIALYLGAEEQIIKALTELCGAQFAGKQ